MPMNTGGFAKFLWPGINAIYGLAYKEHVKEYPAMFKDYTSEKAFEEDVGAIGFGLATVITEGRGVQYDEGQQGNTKRYTHVEYGLGFIITKNMYEDNQYQLPMLSRATGLAFSLNQTMEIVAANVFNNGFSNTYAGADGKAMCATDHPNVSGGTWANELATGADLSEAALEQATIDIGNFTNDRGMRINIRPVRLVIPVNLNYESIRVLKSELQSDSGEHNTNALRVSGAIPETSMNHYLTDTDAWFIITDCPNGLKHFVRQAPKFKEDNDFDTENAKYKATYRDSWGWTDPRGVFGSCPA